MRVYAWLEDIEREREKIDEIALFNAHMVKLLEDYTTGIKQNEVLF